MANLDQPLAETMTLCAAACAGIYPILHLGRPWFFYWLFPYPNTMTLWPQFRSPLLWDFMALFTYVIGSVVFWYFGLLPDLASIRDRARSRFAQLFYGVLAFGFRGTGGQWRHYRAVYGIMAALMAPLVVSVHSIVGLDFAGGETVGWHSTQFPPFFVFGALLSGFATVILLVIPVRHFFHLEAFMTERHLDVLGKLVRHEQSLHGVFVHDGRVLDLLRSRSRREDDVRRARLRTLLVRLLVHHPVQRDRCRSCSGRSGCGSTSRWSSSSASASSSACGSSASRSWSTSLHRTNLPSAWGNFWPSFWDWGVMGGTVGLFLTGILLLIRVVPVVSMAEMREILRERT